MSKSIRNDYSFSQFGLQLIKAWPSFLVALGFLFLQCDKNTFRISLLPLQPVPMDSEHANLLGMTLPEPKLFKHCSRYASFNFSRKSPPNLEKNPDKVANFGGSS